MSKKISSSRIMIKSRIFTSYPLSVLHLLGRPSNVFHLLGALLTFYNFELGDPSNVLHLVGPPGTARPKKSFGHGPARDLNAIFQVVFERALQP